MSTECAVCYVTDINYLLPSLVSASGVRKFVPADKADIYIFLIDEEARVNELNRFLKPYAMHVLPMSSSVYSDFDKSKFHKSYVTYAALGRFFIDTMLPDTCKRIIYIGDTWIRRDPSALIELDVTPGKFAAVNDMASFRYSNITPRGRIVKPYFDSLDLKAGAQYFNSGVFAIARKSWRPIADEAYKFYVANTASCKYHDQSALNAIMGDRRVVLSLKWNFQTPFRFLGIERQLDPHIYHFHSFPKAWMGACKPWDGFGERVK